MLQSALDYADLGYRVFPCAPGEKRPTTANGLLDATTDADTLATWWTAHPSANVAIATDGLLVLDVDPLADGLANPWLTPDRAIDLAMAPCSRTPRGGRHYFFKAPEGANLRNSASKIANRIDTCAAGGYVLVAPSVVAGKAYQWAGEPLDCEPDKLPEPPAWLLESIDSKPGASVRNDRPAAANQIPDGQRNATLASLGGIDAQGRHGSSCDPGSAPEDQRGPLRPAAAGRRSRANRR